MIPMNDWPDYELVDFGSGRKLERFGEWVLDRPCPSAAGVRQARSGEWRRATARFEGDRAADGSWSPAVERWESAGVELQATLSPECKFRMQLSPLPSGQVGAFLEQLGCWRWIDAQVKRVGACKVLNLFAYTGGSTLAAAVSGAEVVHVDAAKSVVERARQNAAASGLADRPIRWL